MSRRHSPQTLQFSAALLGLALLPTTAAATEPTTQQCANLPAPQPTFWPLYERPNGQSAQDFMIDPQDALNGLRNYIWNNFGEFQGSSQNWVPNNYVHTGIDLNAIYSPTGGDFVVVAQSGYIWGAHNFNPVSDGCTHAYNCKLYLRTDDHRYTYYYGSSGFSVAR